MSEFKKLTDYIKVIDPLVRWDTMPDNRYRLSTNKRCDDIQHKYGDLEFILNMTKITIHPRGYLSPSFGNEN